MTRGPATHMFIVEGLTVSRYVKQNLTCLLLHDPLVQFKAHCLGYKRIDMSHDEIYKVTESFKNQQQHLEVV